MRCCKTCPSGTILNNDVHTIDLSLSKEVHTLIIGIVKKVLEHCRNISAGNFRMYRATASASCLVGSVVHKVASSTITVVISPDMLQAKKMAHFMCSRATFFKIILKIEWPVVN